MAAKIELSVCITYHRGERFIEECLKSLSNVLERARLCWELLIFDNECSEGSCKTLTVATQGLTADSVEIIRTGENLGFGAANNRLIERVKGPLTLLLNQDTRFDALPEDSVQPLLRIKDQIIVPLLYSWDGEIQPNEFRFPSVWKYLLQTWGFSRVLGALRSCYYFSRRKKSPYEGGSTYPSAAALFVATPVFGKHGVFDQSIFMYHEECDWFLRLRRKNCVVIVPDFRIRVTHFGSGSIPLSPMLHAEFYCNLAYVLSEAGANRRLYSVLLQNYVLALKLRQLTSGLWSGRAMELPSDRIYRHRDHGGTVLRDSFYREAVRHATEKLRRFQATTAGRGVDA